MSELTFPLLPEPMIDIETWDNTPSAVIRALGVVLFDPISCRIAQRISIDARGTLDDQLEHGRTIGQASVRFWHEQADQARYLGQALRDHRDDPEITSITVHSATELTAMIRQTLSICDHKATIWGRGYFDREILEHLFRSLDEPVPWHFRQIGDLRTLDRFIAPSRATRPHDPISDCEAQIEHLEAMRERMRMAETYLQHIAAQG